MLLKRWITAVVLIPVLLLILLNGAPAAFTALVEVLALAGMAEYFNMVTPTSSKVLPYNGHQARIPIKIQFVAYLVSAAIIYSAHTGSVQMLLIILAMNIIALSFAVVFEFSQSSPILDSVMKEIQGVVYIPLFLSFLVLIRNSDNGAHWVVWLWVVIGLSDTGAYYVGSNYGRRPLAKNVSPKKTVEGALGGLLAAVLAGVLYSFFIDISIPMAALFSLLTAASGQIGDLFESALKRSNGIKDSGTILPGHGGVLDRIDGLIFAAPVAYLFKVFVL